MLQNCISGSEQDLCTSIFGSNEMVYATGRLEKPDGRIPNTSSFDPHTLTKRAFAGEHFIDENCDSYRTLPYITTLRVRLYMDGLRSVDKCATQRFEYSFRTNGHDLKKNSFNLVVSTGTIDEFLALQNCQKTPDSNLCIRIKNFVEREDPCQSLVDVMKKEYCLKGQSDIPNFYYGEKFYDSLCYFMAENLSSLDFSRNPGFSLLLSNASKFR
uniref:Uncharacterized protein n=1 Tax=Romanomermis culicivorax TaxID=13658 RepID=A0A915K7X0_ROMCU